MIKYISHVKLHTIYELCKIKNFATERNNSAFLCACENLMYLLKVDRLWST